MDVATINPTVGLILSQLTWHHQRKLGNNLPSYGWLLLNAGWCESLHHKTARPERLYSLQGGLQIYITYELDLWDFTQWRMVCKFTSHKNWTDETILNEGWCETLHHITMKLVRLYSMQGGLQVYITYELDLWDYTHWRMVCKFTSHKNWTDETILNEGWCETLHHITMKLVRLYSMTDGVNRGST